MRPPRRLRRSPARAALGPQRRADLREDVAPILFKNCAACHRDGGMAPFSVLDYDSTVARADEMRAAVAQGQMPPWHAEGPRGHFLNDRRLTDADKQTILRWIDAGTPRGDMK